MNPDYTAFGTVDFAVDDRFLSYYFKPDSASRQFWDAWLAAHPDKESEWQEARRLVEAVVLGLSDYARTYLSEEAEAELLARIQATNRMHNRPRFLGTRSLTRVAVAASIVIALVGGSFWFLKTSSVRRGSYAEKVGGMPRGMKEWANRGGSPETFTLPDSSKVTLSPGSRISFPKNYGLANRPTWLSGHAVFDVSRNPRKPFLVYSGEVVTKVLGTKFEVSAFDHDRDVTVSVISGQVSVYERKAASKPTAATHSGVLLAPNQQVVFVRRTGQFNKALVSNPSVIASGTASFIYDEQRVAQVLDDIARAYGVEIVYSREILEHCYLTADLARETLQEKLDIICRSINADYEIVEAQIIINSAGCKIN
ncbi:FecR domain-containing protein [Dyadobacter sp. 676]|uniref:FecR domain-containing protein n=1 Tax=Dyadobacter sp. 676 TaxID=3088362 RepID=A0AAU8FMD8_9BACT